MIENPAMIGAGVPIAADGVVSSLTEFGFGGDTSNVPFGTTQLWGEAIQGICEEVNE